MNNNSELLSYSLNPNNPPNNIIKKIEKTQKERKQKFVK